MISIQPRLIRASSSDDSWLEGLRRSVYQELFQATWGGWDETRHVRHFSECLERGHISIIEVNGVRVGMVQLFDEPDAVEVGEIQVQPSDQNRGIGTRVLMDVLADANQNGKCVRLSVGLKNDRAFRLYERLGFQRVGQSDTHNHMEHEPMGERRTVSTGSPYEPIVGISRAVRIGNVVAVAGTAPLGADGKTVGIGDARAQARRCFEISMAALEKLGAKPHDVVRTRILLTRIDDWKIVAEVHGELFRDIRPANTIMQVSRFVDPDWLVETEVDAVVAERDASSEG